MTDQLLSRLAPAVLLLALGCGDDETTPEPAADPCVAQRAGTACSWLGLKGNEGFNGDGQQRWQTQVNQVQDLVFLPDGRAWFSDFNNHLIREVGADGLVVSRVGATDPPFPGDGPLGGPPSEGAAGAEWQLFHPTSLLAARAGSATAVVWHNHKLLAIDTTSGWVTIAAGGGVSGKEAGFSGDGGDAKLATLEQPSDGTRDDAGNLYLIDQLNSRVRRIDAAGVIDTIAGNGERGDGGDGGAAVDAQLSWAGGANPNPSGGIVHHEGRLFIADTDANRIRVVDIQSGVIEAFAGTGASGFSGDGGPALQATFRGPRDLAIGPEGDLYVADTDNGAVRAIDLASGEIRTVVGTGELGMDDGEQLPAEQTRLRRPFGLAFDADGDLYVADTLNSRIVKVAR